MALDVYVGPLTRFYTGSWRPILAQASDGADPDCGKIGKVVERAWDLHTVASDGQLQGVETKVNRAYLRPAAVAQERIEAWRQEVNEALAARSAQPVSWTEANAGEYFTDKPGWDPYGAVLLWAAHEEHPEVERPAVVPEDLGADGAFQASSDESAPSRYPTLLRSDFWLPGGHSFTFKCRSPVGVDITLGFTGALLGDLQRLNSRTWRASDWRVGRWFRTAARSGDPLEPSAKFGFAVLYRLAKMAVDHDLPMVLDW